jgi:hypothetical protein
VVREKIISRQIGIKQGKICTKINKSVIIFLAPFKGDFCNRFRALTQTAKGIGFVSKPGYYPGCYATLVRIPLLSSSSIAFECDRWTPVDAFARRAVRGLGRYKQHMQLENSPMNLQFIATFSIFRGFIFRLLI